MSYIKGFTREQLKKAVSIHREMADKLEYLANNKIKISDVFEEEIDALRFNRALREYFIPYTLKQYSKAKFTHINKDVIVSLYKMSMNSIERLLRDVYGIDKSVVCDIEEDVFWGKIRTCGLKERYLKVLELRYIDNKLLEEIGQELGVTRERVRQLLDKAQRTLKYKLVNIFEDIYNQDIEFIEDLQPVIECAKEKIIEKRVKQELPPTEEEQTQSNLDIPINLLELSVRGYNCLRRAGCNTVKDIVDLFVDDGLHKCRNLGSKSEKEVIEKLKELKVIGG